MNKAILLEVSLDSVESAIAAQEGGAARIELCTNLRDGGITPSVGLITTVRNAITIGLHVIIRPRTGDFFYSDYEFEIMKYDIINAKSLGADGIAVGILTKENEIDLPRMAAIVHFAKPMEVIFHRAFDEINDPNKAMRELIDIGVDRILTSGQATAAEQGTKNIRELVEHAHNRIAIMAGGGINHQNIRTIIKNTGVTEIHVGTAVTAPTVDVPLRFFRTDRTLVNALLVRDLFNTAQKSTG
jgi:copper homeostasis protein